MIDMNYFKLYETQRNHLKVGSKWEWKSNWFDNYSIVEILDVRGDGLVIYRYTQYRFIIYETKKDFLHIFKPYVETST